jgi:Protein of unknown function (DUF3592)
MLEKMLHHKLLEEGERGRGVVTKRHDQAAESGTHTFSILFEIEGHIKFPDGTESEFKSEWLSSHKVGDIREGDVVPVRYDAADRSRVVLDVVSLEEHKSAALERAKAWEQEHKDEAIADADARIARGDAATTSEPGHDDS